MDESVVSDKMNEEVERFVTYIFQDFLNNVNDPSNLIHKFIVSFLIVVVWIGILKVGKKSIHALTDNVKFTTLIYKLFKNVIGAISILLLLSIWMKLQKTVLFVLIVIGLLTAFSIKNLSTNLVAWFMLLRKKYFKLYDRIEIDGIKGDVIKITPFYFKVIERGNSLSSSSATGRVIHMPNHILLNTPLYNYNEFIKVNWEEVTYHLTVDSDWKKAQELINKEVNAYVADFTAQLTEKEIQKITRKSALFDEELKLKSYVLINDATIEIITQFPIEYTKGTSTKSLLNEKIIPKLQNTPNIELSGKTIYMHLNNLQDIKNRSFH